MGRPLLREKGAIRAPTFWLPMEEGVRFQGAVPPGSRGKAMESLFMLASAAASTDRHLWLSLVESPEKLEIRRKR